MKDQETASTRWYQGVTRYQWLVLIIASIGDPAYLGGRQGRQPGAHAVGQLVH